MNSLIKRNIQVDYIIVDGSISMQDKWLESMRAVEAYVDTLKVENVNSDIYLHLFHSFHSADMVGFDGNISSWENNAMRLELPAGSTALYDAIAIGGRRLRDFDPPRCRVTIVTDGDDTDSRTTDITQAKSILDWMRAKGWQVTFIGADFSNHKQARMLGADDSSAIGVAKARLTDAARAYGKKAARHAHSGEDMGFSKDEQQQFGGYLAGPSK